MIDDVTLWSKLEYTWQVYSIFLILFRRRTIFKMLALEQSAEPVAPGVGSSDRSDPPSLATGLKSLQRFLGVESRWGMVPRS